LLVSLIQATISALVEVAEAHLRGQTPVGFDVRSRSPASRRTRSSSHACTFRPLPCMRPANRRGTSPDAVHFYGCTIDFKSSEIARQTRLVWPPQADVGSSPHIALAKVTRVRGDPPRWLPKGRALPCRERSYRRRWARLRVGDVVIRSHVCSRLAGPIVRVASQRRREARPVWVKWDHPCSPR